MMIKIFGKRSGESMKPVAGDFITVSLLIRIDILIRNDTLLICSTTATILVVRCARWRYGSHVQWLV